MNTAKKEFNGVGPFKSKALLFLICFSGILVIILASNLEIFCIPKYNRAFGISNEELFFIYSAIFTIINVLLLKFSRTLEPSVFKIRTILFMIILINQLLLASILFLIYGQIKIISQYNNALLYGIIYASLISSTVFLAISGAYFLRWFTRGRNYLVLTYGIVMLILFANSIIGAVYLSQISVTHGIMFLFASKDISTLIISSYPPLGAVSIAFLGLASYMVYLGIYSAATLTARDKNLRKDLRQKVESNVMLLKSIATSQDELDIEKEVKHVMNLSTQWQEENRQLDMTTEEIREIARDVVLMVKMSKK